MHFLRNAHTRRGIVSTAEATGRGNGQRVETSGLVLVRQRPGSASGVVFITLEDETGIANLVVWPRVLERFRPVVMRARILHVIGRVQSAENVTHIVAERLIDCTDDLSLLSEEALRDPLNGVLAPPDALQGGVIRAMSGSFRQAATFTSRPPEPARLGSRSTHPCGPGQVRHFETVFANYSLLHNRVGPILRMSCKIGDGYETENTDCHRRRPPVRGTPSRRAGN